MPLWLRPEILGEREDRRVIREDGITRLQVLYANTWVTLAWGPDLQPETWQRWLGFARGWDDA